MVERGLELSSSEGVYVASCCEHGSENMNHQLSGSRECGEFFE